MNALMLRHEIRVITKPHQVLRTILLDCCGGWTSARDLPYSSGLVLVDSLGALTRPAFVYFSPDPIKMHLSYTSPSYISMRTPLRTSLQPVLRI